MMYDQLVRVNKIDTEIARMHQHLSALYQERQAIIIPKKDAPTAVPIKIYEDASIQWRHRGITLPSFPAFKSRLDAVMKIRHELNFANQTTVLVVPPAGKIEKAVQDAVLQNGCPEISYSEPSLEKLHQRTRTWRVMLVVEKPQVVTDNNLAQFVAENNQAYKGYDFGAMDLQAALAYGLQTGTWPDQNQWLLLLGDADEQGVLCMAQYQGKLLIDRDASEALIGDNFFKPTLLVEGQRSA